MAPRKIHTFVDARGNKFDYLRDNCAVWDSSGWPLRQTTPKLVGVSIRGREFLAEELEFKGHGNPASFWQGVYKLTHGNMVFGYAVIPAAGTNRGGFTFEINNGAHRVYREEEVARKVSRSTMRNAIQVRRT